MLPISDVTTSTIAYALRGLATRADVRADNLANVNTPGFVSGNVDFESVLADALGDGDADAQDVRDLQVEVSQNLPNGQGNLVSAEGEMVGMLKDQLQRNALVNALNTKQNMFRTAIGSR